MQIAVMVGLQTLHVLILLQGPNSVQTVLIQPTARNILTTYNTLLNRPEELLTQKNLQVLPEPGVFLRLFSRYIWTKCSDSRQAWYNSQSTMPCFSRYAGSKSMQGAG